MIPVNNIEGFSVDFSDSDLIVAGKAYPKGTFAVNMLNRDKGKNTALLTEALPLYEILQERAGGFFSPELFEKAKKATRKVAEMLYGDEPFSLLDVKAEKAKLELLFSDEVRDFLCLYDEGLTEYRKAQSEPDFREEEIDEEARAFLRQGERLRYQNRGEQSSSDFIRDTAEDLKLTEKTVVRYLEEIEARNHFVDFYRVDEEDDEDFTGEDVTVDHEPTPDILVPSLLEGDKIDKALSGLSRRELDLIEGRFGFCATCFQNKETLSFDDLADKYQFTTEEGAEKAFVRAFEALLRGLVAEDYCHAVVLDKAGDTPKKRVIHYRYQPDFLGDPGEIEFDLRHPARNAFTVLKLAEMDVTGVFAEQTAGKRVSASRKRYRAGSRVEGLYQAQGVRYSERKHSERHA